MLDWSWPILKGLGEKKKFYSIRLSFNLNLDYLLNNIYEIKIIINVLKDFYKLLVLESLVTTKKIWILNRDWKVTKVLLAEFYILMEKKVFFRSIVFKLL